MSPEIRADVPVGGVEDAKQAARSRSVRRLTFMGSLRTDEQGRNRNRGGSQQHMVNDEGVYDRAIGFATCISIRTGRLELIVIS